MSDLGKAWVQIVPSAKGISGSISKVLKGESESAGTAAGSSIAGKIKGAIAAAGIGVALGATIKSAIGAGADLEQSIGGIETLFKGSADKMKAYAADAFKTAGISSNEYMQTVTSFSASLLQGLSGDTDKAADISNMALTDMSDNANKFGSDMQSIQMAYQGFAKQNYTMLDNLKLGYGGTKTEMERLLKDAEAISGVHYDIDNLADVYNAIHVIQTELGVTGTTAEEAASTLSGSFAMAKAAATDLLANLSLGTAGAEMEKVMQNMALSVTNVVRNLFPAITNVLTGIPPMITAFFANLAPWLLEQGGVMITNIIQGWSQSFQGMLTAVAGAVKMIAGKVGEGVPTLLEAAGNLLQTIISEIVDALPDFIDAAVSLVSGLIEGITDSLPDLLDMGIEMVGQIIDGLLDTIPEMIDAGVQLLTAIVDNMPKIISTITSKLPELINKIISALADHIPDIVEAGVKLLTSLIQNLPTIITTIVSAAPQIIKAIIDALTQNLPQIIKMGFDLFVSLIKNLPQIIVAILKAIPQIISGLISAFTNNQPKIVQSGFSLFTSLIKNLSAIITNIVKAVPQIISGIVGAFENGVSQMAQVGMNLMKGIGQGILNGASEAINKAKEVAGNILSAAKKKLGIASPSKEFAKVGKFIDEGLAQGILKNLDPVQSAMNELGKTATADLESRFSIGTQGLQIAGEPGESGASGNITINIYPREGQSEESIAEMVSRRLSAELSRQREVFA